MIGFKAFLIEDRDRIYKQIDDIAFRHSSGTIENKMPISSLVKVQEFLVGYGEHFEMVKKGKYSKAIEVSIKKLIASQKNVDVDKLKNMVNGFSFGKELPKLHKIGSSYYILDGHHRIIAQLLLGAKKIKGIVYQDGK